MTFPFCAAKKIGMTQVFGEDGIAIPVTVLEFLPLTVTQLKTEEKDGYVAAQFGYLPAKEKHLSRAEQGHLADSSLFRHLKEGRLDSLDGVEVGKQQSLSEEDVPFSVGQAIAVSGVSIGKGFAGGTKRWGFSRGPMSHGSKSHRIPGSIGAGTTPGRVIKGKRMAGHMGARNTTLPGVSVVAIDAEKNVILVKGSVPGANGALVTLAPEKKPMRQSAAV